VEVQLWDPGLDGLVCTHCIVGYVAGLTFHVATVDMLHACMHAYEHLSFYHFYVKLLCVGWEP